jgi:hypothetical protein
MIAWAVRTFAAWRQRENVRFANDAFSLGEWRMLRAETWAGVIRRWRNR